MGVMAGGENWSESGFTVRFEPASFLYGFYVGFEMRGAKDDSQDMRMKLWKEAVMSSEIGKTVTLADLGSILCAHIGACQV